MRLVSLWKSIDTKKFTIGNYWVRLYAGKDGYHYDDQDGGGKAIGHKTLEEAIQHVQENVLAHWPAKAIRYH